MTTDDFVSTGMWMVHIPCGRPVWRVTSEEDGFVRYYERPSFETLRRIFRCPGCGSSLPEAERNNTLMELIELDRDVPTPS